MVFNVKINTLYTPVSYCIAKKNITYDLNQTNMLLLDITIIINEYIKNILKLSNNKEYIINIIDEEDNHLWIFNLKTDNLKTIIKINPNYIGKKIIFNLYGYEYKSNENLKPLIDKIIETKEIIIKEPIKFSEKSCIFCLDDIKQEEDIFMSECNHTFHKKCIKISQQHLFMVSSNEKCNKYGCKHNLKNNIIITLSKFKCPICRKIGII
jgi:hypothetical protein